MGTLGGARAGRSRGLRPGKLQLRLVEPNLLQAATQRRPRFTFEAEIAA